MCTGVIATLILVILLQLSSASAIGVQLAGSQELCFIEELNPTSEVLVKYKMPTLGTPGNPTSVHIRVIGPLHTELLSYEKTLVQSEFHFQSFPDYNLEEYTICFTLRLPFSLQGNQRKFKLNVNIEVSDYEKEEHGSLESKGRIDCKFEIGLSHSVLTQV